MTANNLARESLAEVLGELETPSYGSPRTNFSSSSSFKNDPDFVPSSSSTFESKGGEIYDEDTGRTRPKRDSFYYLMQSARKKKTAEELGDKFSWSSLTPI
jgi:hypothetical protein